MASPSKSKPAKGGGPGKDAQEASTAATEVARDEQHQDKKVMKDVGGGEKAASPANSRRQTLPAKLFVFSTLLTGLAAAAVWHLGEKRIEERLAALTGRPAAAAAAPAGADEGRIKVIEEQITALQKQLDAWRREQLTSQKELRESIERVAASRSAPAAPAAPIATLPAGSFLDGQGTAGVSRTAEMVASVTPTQAEFIQLKERNRITAYADEAIATGMRKPLETIVEYIRGSGSDHLRDAAQAEYLRVLRMIQFFQREDPGFRLPVAELFKAENLRNEADLKPAHLFQLLADAKQPWEVRVRAAVLLKGSDSPDTNAKLIEAIKNDPSLEVAKHAQICLEQRVQRRFRFFDIPSIEEWQKQQETPAAK